MTEMKTNHCRVGQHNCGIPGCICDCHKTPVTVTMTENGNPPKPVDGIGVTRFGNDDPDFVSVPGQFGNADIDDFSRAVIEKKAEVIKEDYCARFGHHNCWNIGCTCSCHINRREMINHPSHYGGAENVYEHIKVVEAWKLGYALGNATKYIARAGKKDPKKTIEDLKKAAWYLNWEIDRLERA